ncbi:uncharacterized protein LOC143766169 [Ranitomeya variabilis]|uniref:uncharacterized protein LOC143766169 n=1 Tax=Ranitomeya variabilis TaxID=490064 RepID=UPI004056EF08
MDRGMKKMEEVLHFTLEILFRLTGEDYTVVKKTSNVPYQAPVSEECGRPLSPIIRPPCPFLIHEDINDQKILELTYQMIELLTGEVPLRRQDVTIYFSMEEWEYLERHKDLYKDVMMEVPQPFTPSVLSSKRTPERCPRAFLAQDCKRENPNVPQHHQGKDLTHNNTTETYVRGDEQCKEEIPTYDYPDDCFRISEGHAMSTDFKADISSTVHTEDLSSDPIQQLLSYELSQNVKKNKRKKVDHQRDQIVENPFSCIKCSKRFTDKSNLVKHEKDHKEVKPFSCSECGSFFTRKSHLVRHLRLHTGEKPYSCSECWKCFTEKSNLVAHMKTHLGDKPFSCSECGKCFNTKSNLVIHQRVHTGEKPFTCSECKKCFMKKSHLDMHQRIHTGEKPFSCSECKKCFKKKSQLVIHHRVHTGEKPFSCLECGLCFTFKSNLDIHQKIHTGEKRYSCSECGKCFSQRSHLVRHQKIHTEEKPFSCSECGKCFIQRFHFLRHQRKHKGENHFNFATDLC